MQAYVRVISGCNLWFANIRQFSPLGRQTFPENDLSTGTYSRHPAVRYTLAFCSYGNVRVKTKAKE
jgi:hypothetical protein